MESVNHSADTVTVTVVGTDVTLGLVSTKVVDAEGTAVNPRAKELVNDSDVNVGVVTVPAVDVTVYLTAAPLEFTSVGDTLIVTFPVLPAAALSLNTKLDVDKFKDTL